MTVVLGIDAAWTDTEPSGIALIVGSQESWRCLAVAPSYRSFFGLAGGEPVDWSERPRGTDPEPRQLLEAAASIAGEQVSLVTVDMPLSTVPICGRREADRITSQTYGARWCSVHSPTPLRPGRLSRTFSRELDAAGYSLATTATKAGTMQRVVEVYPHTALLALLQCDRRVPYKVSRAAKYWPGVGSHDRITRLLQEFRTIESALRAVVQGLEDKLRLPTEASTLAGLKRYEDALDAVICCWVGVEYARGSVTALGDDTCAIWCPETGSE